LTAREPTVAAIAGTGGGKTVVGMVTLLGWMAQNPGEQWLVAEPTDDMLERVLLTPTPGRVTLLQLLQVVDPAAHYRKSDRIIKSALGTIYLDSATNPGAWEGMHIRGAWLDEAGQMSKLAFETATRRVGFKAGQVLLTTTPYNRGWLYRDVYQGWQRGDKDIFVSRFSSLANPRYPRATYERNKRTMDAARFDMMHEGGFSRPEGMIYTPWSDQLIVKPFEIPADWWRGAGIDFGYNHPTAAVWGARSPDGVYYIYRIYRRAETTIDKHHAAITQPHPNGQAGVWWADTAAKQERAELARLGLPTQPADKEVAAGINTVYQLMAAGRMKVFEGLTEWVDEVESYIWDKKQELFIDQPVKLDDDLMDATRYLLHSAETKQGMRLYT
jgi:hypothetical protein